MEDTGLGLKHLVADAQMETAEHFPPTCTYLGIVQQAGPFKKPVVAPM